MAYIGRQQSSSTFLKLDDISSQFNTSTTTFNLTLGGEAFFAGNPYSLLVSLGGVYKNQFHHLLLLKTKLILHLLQEQVLIFLLWCLLLQT